jgi:hypothetical protein
VTKGTTSGPALLGLIGVASQDTKNFVPVDWVSSVIAHAIQTPAARGATYHLTHPEPLSMDTIGRLIQQAVEAYSQDASPDDPDLCDEDWFADNLRTQLDVYKTYLRNDPTFDSSRTAAIAAQLPCPPLDMPILLKMAKFAIDHEFGRKSPWLTATHSPPMFAELRYG